MPVDEQLLVRLVSTLYRYRSMGAFCASGSISTAVSSVPGPAVVTAVMGDRRPPRQNPGEYCTLELDGGGKLAPGTTLITAWLLVIACLLLNLRPGWAALLTRRHALRAAELWIR